MLAPLPWWHLYYMYYWVRRMGESHWVLMMMPDYYTWGPEWEVHGPYFCWEEALHAGRRLSVAANDTSSQN